MDGITERLMLWLLKPEYFVSVAYSTSPYYQA